MVLYATVERVKRDGDIRGTSMNAQIASALEAATLTISGDRPGKGLLGRRFWPEVATRYFSALTTHTDDLPLGRYELADLPTVVTNSGTSLTVGTDVYAEPQDGPPYNTLQLSSAVTAAWSSALRGVAVTGPWGFRIDEQPAGVTAAAVGSTSATSINVTDSSTIGTGSIIKIDNERMIVTGRSLLTTGQNTTGALDAENFEQIVPVGSGAAFVTGETITIDAEIMLITDIAGNNLIVERAYDGSTLDNHLSGATVYAPRTLTVQRGALGTAAATHNLSAAVLRFQFPALVEQLAVAEALDTLNNTQGSYAGVSAGQDGSVMPGGISLADLRKVAQEAFRPAASWLGV